jgi:hypothetical protein
MQAAAQEGHGSAERALARLLAHAPLRCSLLADAAALHSLLLGACDSTTLASYPPA